MYRREEFHPQISFVTKWRSMLQKLAMTLSILIVTPSINASLLPEVSDKYISNSLNGINFFDLFKLPKNSDNQSNPYEIVEIFKKEKITLRYMKISFASSDQSPAGFLSYEGFDTTLFWFTLDKSNIIQNVEMLKAADVLPKMAVLILKNDSGFKQLADAFNIPLDSDLGPYIHKANSILAKQTEEKKRLNAVKQRHDFGRDKIRDSDSAYPVLQHQFSIVKYDPLQPKNSIKTFGAADCIIVSIYDKKTKVGMLAHVDPMTDFRRSMAKISYSFNKQSGRLYLKTDNNSTNVDIGDIEVSMIGSRQASRDNIIEITNVLNQYHVSPVRFDILTNEDSESALLDLSDGKLYSFILDVNLETNTLPTTFFLEIEMLIAAGMTPLREIKIK